jgi:hypothetical protein
MQGWQQGQNRFFPYCYGCHGAPQSRSDQDGTPLTRITDEEEKL